MPVPQRIALGKRGEEVAQQYIEETLGWKILSKNWRWKNYEIDIVAEEPESGKIIFVEVKTASGRYLPENQIDKGKEEALAKGAESWLAHHQQYENREIRFDVIAVHLFRHDKYKVLHFKDAFYPVDTGHDS